MPSLKEQVIKWISSLPDDCTIEDIRYHLHLRERVEAGLRDAEEGRTFTQKEAEMIPRSWIAARQEGQSTDSVPPTPLIVEAKAPSDDPT